MVLTKITRISGFPEAGVLDGWSWPRTTADFADINLVYGANGSGKSTLARMLAGASPQISQGVEVSLKVKTDDGSDREVESFDDAFWDRTRVFNRDFVDRNFKFDSAQGSTAEPLLILGEQNIRNQDRRREIQAELERISSQISELQGEETSLERDSQVLLRDVARTISQELNSVDPKYSPRTYNAKAVRGVIPQISAVDDAMSDEQIAKDLKLVSERRLPVVSPIGNSVFDLTELARRVREILLDVPQNSPLADLERAAELESWVEAGLRLHSEGDSCSFCRGQLSRERLSQLFSHFDPSYRRLQARIRDAEGELHSQSERIDQTLGQAPASTAIFSDLVDRYGEALEDCRVAASGVKESIGVLLASLARKRSAGLACIELETGVLPLRLLLGDLNAVIGQHNGRSRAFRDSIQGAAIRVERARIAAIVDDYREIDGRVQEISVRLSSLAERKAELEREEVGLDSQYMDASTLANDISRDLSSLLGRSELALSYQGEFYSITRNGQSATCLSEGEMTAISLLYFLASLREKSCVGRDLVIVLDDPVSSMDHGILIGASAFIWSALVGVEGKHQLFLLTHSFDLFRIWAGQLMRGSKKTRKFRSYSIFELRSSSRCTSDQTPSSRKATLHSWPSDKLGVQLLSQYHYLFWRVSLAVHGEGKGAGLDGEVEAAAVLPNVARKLLESFLAFRYPSSIGNFEGSLERGLEDGRVSLEVKQRLVRFLHGHSHNEEADTLYPVEAGESVLLLKAVLDYMRSVDVSHFDEMCGALGISR